MTGQFEQLILNPALSVKININWFRLLAHQKNKLPSRSTKKFKSNFWGKNENALKSRITYLTGKHMVI